MLLVMLVFMLIMCGIFWIQLDRIEIAEMGKDDCNFDYENAIVVF